MTERKLCRVEICFNRTTGELYAKGIRAEEYFDNADGSACFLAFDGEDVFGFSGRELMVNAAERVRFAVEHPERKKVFVAKEKAQKDLQRGRRTRKMERRAGRR